MAMLLKPSESVLDLLAHSYHLNEAWNCLFLQTVLLDAFAVGVYHKDGLATVLVEFIVLKGLLGQSDPHSKDHFVFFVPFPLNETLLKGLFDNLNGVLVSV